METNILPQIHKISRITDSYGITKYLGRTYKNNEVALEQGCILENVEFSETDFHKQVTTVTCDETKHETYTVPVGRCFLHTSVNVPNFVDMHHNALICIGVYKKKEEPRKISDIKNAYSLFLVDLL